MQMTMREVTKVFCAFALAYFISTLIRAVTATLSTTLTVEFELKAHEIGLLAGGYFLGFALTQLHLGKWLDEYGPKRVILSFLCVAVLGCVAFALAENFIQLLIGRVLCGVGVSACLMAPLTAYRHWFKPEMLLRANSWMLMVGAFGMMAATLPVQWAITMVSWRMLFLALAISVILAMLLITYTLPKTKSDGSQAKTDSAASIIKSYSEIWRSPTFKKMAPIGFVNYGGMVAIQTLWAAPWMSKVAGYTAQQTASALFGVNLSMLIAFLIWGSLNPMLNRRGWSIDYILTKTSPVSIAIIGLIAIGGHLVPKWAALGWIAFCLSSTVGAQVQPSVGMAFRPELAGRALSAFNLVIFIGVFSVQWAIGLLVDTFGALGASEISSYRAAMGVYCGSCLITYINFLRVSKS